MSRSLWAVIAGTFTLRFSTGLTGAMLAYFLARPQESGLTIDALTLGLLHASFYASELGLSPIFGPIADRFGYHRIMELGPAFGAIAVVLTGLTPHFAALVAPLLALWVLGGTRFLEGASTAASVPSILGYIAMATSDEESLRGRAVARFEAATLAGIGGGLVLAGPLFTALGSGAFYLNAALYGGSWCIYRFGISDPRIDRVGARPEARTSLDRYLEILRGAHVWILAPTWIAINAVIGLWTAQSLFLLVKEREPRFANQLLTGGFSPNVVSLGLAVGVLLFFAGLVYWGNRFRSLRRTTIIFYGIGGGAVLAVSTLAINHGAGLPAPVMALLAAFVVVGLFVLAGATPAALGLLADMAEPYPRDRGAIMGLYSVFLGVGQIGGSLIGGFAAREMGIDGILVGTLALLGVALVPLWHLRTLEHRLPGSHQVPVGPEG